MCGVSQISQHNYNSQPRTTKIDQPDPEVLVGLSPFNKTADLALLKSASFSPSSFSVSVKASVS